MLTIVQEAFSSHMWWKVLELTLNLLTIAVSLFAIAFFICMSFKCAGSKYKLNNTCLICMSLLAVGSFAQCGIDILRPQLSPQAGY